MIKVRGDVLPDEFYLRMRGERGSNAGLSRKEHVQIKLDKAAQGTGGSGRIDFIGKDGDVPVHASQSEMINSITNAGATYVGPTTRSSKIGSIYRMDTAYGNSMEIRVL